MSRVYTQSSYKSGLKGASPPPAPEPSMWLPAFAGPNLDPYPAGDPRLNSPMLRALTVGSQR